MELDRVGATLRTISVPAAVMGGRRYVVAMASLSLSHLHILQQIWSYKLLIRINYKCKRKFNLNLQ
jgi:hypothetical protein